MDINKYTVTAIMKLQNIDLKSEQNFDENANIWYQHSYVLNTKVICLLYEVLSL